LVSNVAPYAGRDDENGNPGIPFFLIRSDLFEQQRDIRNLFAELLFQCGTFLFAEIYQMINRKKINVEIKSLNSKAMDLSTRIAPAYREKEIEIRNEFLRLFSFLEVRQ